MTGGTELSVKPDDGGRMGHFGPPYLFLPKIKPCSKSKLGESLISILRHFHVSLSKAAGTFR